uniref:Biogenesis of lysosome-related organelles complex 1 subunit 7 n=1 Tax=Triatoma infestans TaxID=30076 RepID=A0A161MFX2_TRIIF
MKGRKRIYIVMDPETGSTNTSLEDKTDDFCENPTRDSLAEGLMSVLKPTIDQLDERVRTTRVSQLELKQQLESLSEELKNITYEQNCPLDLEIYSQKLLNSRHKITVVSNILQAAQDRLHKIQTLINKENSKRKIVVENPQPVSALDPDLS